MSQSKHKKSLKTNKGDVACCCVLQCVAVCCSLLQCVTACCSQQLWCSVVLCVAVCVAVRCSVLQSEAHRLWQTNQGLWLCCRVLQCAAVCCNVLQRVALRGVSPVTNKQGVTVVLQYVAVWSTVLQSKVHGPWQTNKGLQFYFSVAVCCNGSHRFAVFDKQKRAFGCIAVLQCVAMYCVHRFAVCDKQTRGSSYVAVRCSVLQCVAGTSSRPVTNKQGVTVMLQCVAVRCSVLQAQVHSLWQTNKGFQLCCSVL